MNSKTYFTIICMERSGSTFLIDALNNEKNIRTDYEFKWRPRFRTLMPEHRVLPGTTFSFKNCLANMFTQANEEIIGTKIAFGINQAYSLMDFIDLKITISDEIKLIYLNRDPIQIIRSSIKKQGHKLKLETPKQHQSNDTNILYTIKEKKNKMSGKTNLDIRVIFFLYKNIIKNQKLIKKFCEIHNNYIEINYDNIRKQETGEQIAYFLNVEYEKDFLTRGHVIPNSKLSISDLFYNSQEIENLFEILEKPKIIFLLRMIKFYKFKVFEIFFSIFFYKLDRELYNLAIRRKIKLLFKWFLK